MQKLQKSDKKSVSAKSKRKPKDLYDLLDKEKGHESGIRNEIFSLLEELNSKVPVYKLIEFESCLGPAKDPVQDNYIQLIIDSRINDLNGFVRSSLKDYKQIRKESYFDWFATLPYDKCHQIINTSSINELARISKEIPPKISIFETMTESLNSMIDKHYRQWLYNKTKSDPLTDLIFDSILPEIGNILALFDTNHDFNPYIKRILFYKFAEHCSEDAKKPANESDYIPDTYPVKHSFITLTLLLFIKLNSKPHHKLVFWHENMYYVRKSDYARVIRKVIDHDVFIKERGSLSLSKLWKMVICRIDLNCKELVNYTDHFDNIPLNIPSEDYSKYILNQFDAFIKNMKDLFIEVYTENEYFHLRKIFPEVKTKQMILLDFFKDEQDNLLNNETIRILLSNWNYRIRTKLFEVFRNQD